MDLSFQRWTQAKALRVAPSLASTLESCRGLSPGDSEVEVAGDVAWVLTEEFDALPAYDRPSLIVFVDTYEKVQDQRSWRAEHALNNLISQLPYALFVMTGRNRLSWDTPRAGLALSGPRVWACLTRDCQKEPHQHLLERLSGEDSRALLSARRDAYRWAIDDALLDQVVARTDGWPLHLEMASNVAQQRSLNGEPLDFDSLVLDLPDLVKRLLADMSYEEAKAFHAMCVVRSFDKGACRANRRRDRRRH